MKARRLISNGALKVRSKTTRQQAKNNTKFIFQVLKSQLIVYEMICFHKFQPNSNVLFCSTETTLLFDIQG